MFLIIAAFILKYDSLGKKIYSMLLLINTYNSLIVLVLDASTLDGYFFSMQFSWDMKHAITVR